MQTWFIAQMQSLDALINDVWNVSMYHKKCRTKQQFFNIESPESNYKVLDDAELLWNFENYFRVYRIDLAFRSFMCL